MYCTECGSALSDQFKFCPACGQAVVADRSSLPIPGNRLPTVREQEILGTSGIRVRPKVHLIGTVILGTFSVMTLLIGFAKGLTPLSLIEATGWATAAWFWQRKKPNSLVATIAIILLAVVITVGEIVFYQVRPSNSARATDHSDIDAIIMGARSDKTYFFPPDQVGITASEKSESCQEANRLSKLCTANHFVPSSPYNEFGGYPVPLGKLTPVPKGYQLDPDQRDCNTSFDWKNYCDITPH
jgi:hypothetical protein